jgi:hypothetical protein
MPELAKVHKGCGIVGGKRRIFNFLESAPIKAFANLKTENFPPLSFPEEFKKA